MRSRNSQTSILYINFKFFHSHLFIFPPLQSSFIFHSLLFSFLYLNLSHLIFQYQHQHNADIDGAFFGPTFPNLFFMTYEEVVPEPVAEQVTHPLPSLIVLFSFHVMSWEFIRLLLPSQMQSLKLVRRVNMHFCVSCLCSRYSQTQLWTLWLSI